MNRHRINEVCQQYLDGLITAGEFQNKLVNAILENPYPLDLPEHPDMLWLAQQLAGPDVS